MFRCFRYLKVLSRSIYIYISVFRQLDIQVGDLFPWISIHHRRQPRSAGPTSGATGADRAVENGAQMERTGGAGIFGLRRRGARQPGRFGGCTFKNVVEQRQKRSARRRGCDTMKGLTIMSCPAQTEKNAQDCLKITRRHFSWGQQEVGIRLYRHRASRNSLERGFSHLAMLDSLQSFCGLLHKHCRALGITSGIKYRERVLY